MLYLETQGKSHGSQQSGCRDLDFEGSEICRQAKAVTVLKSAAKAERIEASDSN